MSDSYFDNSRIDYSVIQQLFEKRLGGGQYRDVYGLAFDDTKVVKVELRAGSFCNVEEHEVWNRLKDTKWAKWLAPVRSICPYGAVMIQERTTPLTEEQWTLCKRIPNFFTDLKAENFGMLNGQIVAHDYGGNLTREIGFSHFRLKSMPAWAKENFIV